MINTTDRPITLVTEDHLNGEIHQALDAAEVMLQNQQVKTNVRPDVKSAFPRFLGKANRRPGLFDDGFIQAAFRFTASDSQNRGSQPAMAAMATYLFERTAQASQYAIVKRGLKLTLVELWRRKALLLPSVFTPASHFAYDAFDHELLKWLLTFEVASDVGASQGDRRRLYFYGPRLLLTTTWATVEDVSLSEIAELSLAHRLYEGGAYDYAMAGQSWPWSQLPAALIRSFPERTSFTKEDVQNFSAWSLRAAVKRGALESFVVPPRRVPSVRLPPLPGAISKSHKPKRNVAAEVQSATTHDAVRTVFANLVNKRKDCIWDQEAPVYPGREHIDLTLLSKKWTESFRAWLHHRKHIQGFRDESEVKASLNMLADYLLFYLPWWRELYPTGNVLLPAAPKDFSRFAFVSRHTSEPIEALPLTLLQIIRLRRPKAETAAPCIKHLTLYFRFVGAQFADDADMAGPAYRNPLDDEFDAPRTSGRKNKTNKQIIPRNIYGHLLFWCYAVEAFGNELLHQALDGRFASNWLTMRSAQRYDTAALCIPSQFRFRGRDMPVRSVPNVFTWSERKVVREGQTVTIAVPHLTALRLLIVSLETGLRCQSVQWLDRTTWDSLNEDAAEGTYCYRLFVNTDKTRVEPWAPPVVFRVRNVLQRETSFQRLFADLETFAPVSYEGLDSSPFELIRPLFKAPNSGRPIGDNIYSDAWLALQVGFQSFYHEMTGERHVRLVRVKPQMTKDGKHVVKFVGEGANAYSAISILAVHTPHSCRATFATNRQGPGMLELTDVAEIIGHDSTVTSAHYTKPSGAQIEERMKHTDQVVLGDFSMFDLGPEGGHIRPDKPDSALVTSFSRDRNATVKSFHFMPSLSLWSMEDGNVGSNASGLELLKSGPMSHIRFRETHICPVGEECPSEILELIGAPKRCGICPLAMKCIDHLPAIAAKRNHLLERIRYQHGQRKRMEEMGEPAASLDAIWDEIQADINELLGWQFSEEVLQGMLLDATRSSSAAERIHVERPDIVRRHLLRVTRTCDRTEFLLQRLAESNAYPSMNTPHVQYAAALLRRRLSAGEDTEALASSTAEGDDVRAVATLLGTMMKVNGMSMKDVTRLLDAGPPTATKPLLLPEQPTDGK